MPILSTVPIVRLPLPALWSLPVPLPSINNPPSDVHYVVKFRLGNLCSPPSLPPSYPCRIRRATSVFDYAAAVILGILPARVARGKKDAIAIARSRSRNRESEQRSKEGGGRARIHCRAAGSVDSRPRRIARTIETRASVPRGLAVIIVISAETATCNFFPY